MDYRKQFHDEAEKTAKPLAGRVRALEKQRVVIGERVRDTRTDIDRKAKALDTHRETAGEKLTISSSAFNEWQGRLRRLTREHETAREALALLEKDIGPKVAKDLAEARQKLQRGLDAFYNAAKVECEERMAVLLAAVVDERDDFLSAWGQVYADFGASLKHGRGDAPVAASDRVDKAYRPHLTGPRCVTFTNKRPVAPEVATPQPEAPTAAPRAAEPEKAPGVAEAPRDVPAGT